jgi:hypothetical protein
MTVLDETATYADIFPTTEADVGKRGVKAAEDYGDPVTLGQTVTRPESRFAATRRKTAKQLMGEEIRSARRLRDRFATSRRDTVRQLAAGAEISFAEALRHAGVRATTKARNRQSAAAAARVASTFERRESLRPFFATLGINESTLLAGSFGAYQQQAQAWLEARRRELRKILREERWDELDVPGNEETDSHAAGFLAAALFALAAARILASDDPAVEPRGEVSGVVPNGIITRALDVADGRAGVTLGASAVEMPTLHSLDTTDLEAEIADGLRSRLLDTLNGELRAREADGADTTSIANAIDSVDTEAPMTEYVWVHGFYGEPKTIFEPHERLDGTRTTDPEGDPAFVNDGDWPDTASYYPGDHLGCACELVAQVPSALDAYVDAVA